MISVMRRKRSARANRIGSFDMISTKETSSTRRAFGCRARAVIALMIGSTALSSCFDPGVDCLTLDDYDRIAASEPELVGVIERTSEGEIVTENKSPWMRDSLFTGESCTVKVSIRDGSAFVSTSFLDEPVELKVPLSERDFYMGLVDRNVAVVVQQTPEGTSATATTFAEDGTLRYGACGERRTWYRECHIAPDPAR